MVVNTTTPVPKADSTGTDTSALESRVVVAIGIDETRVEERRGEQTGGVTTSTIPLAVGPWGTPESYNDQQ
jgi:hypothetical protein